MTMTSNKQSNNLDQVSFADKRQVPKSLLWIIIAVLVLGAAFWVWQTQFQPARGPIEPIPDKASLDLVSQVTDTQKVLVQAAALTEDGYVVIYQDKEGLPGKIIGNSRFLKPGFHNNILVSVQGLDFGKNTLHVMIHTDDGDEVFNPPLDTPFVQEGEIVAESVEVDFQPKLEGGKG